MIIIESKNIYGEPIVTLQYEDGSIESMAAEQYEKRKFTSMPKSVWDEQQTKGDLIS